MGGGKKKQNNNNNNTQNKSGKNGGGGGYVKGGKDHNLAQVAALLASGSSVAMDPMMMMAMCNSGGSGNNTSKSLMPLLLAQNANASGSSGAASSQTSGFDAKQLAMLQMCGGGGNIDPMMLILMQQQQAARSNSTASVPATVCNGVVGGADLVPAKPQSEAEATKALEAESEAGRLRDEQQQVELTKHCGVIDDQAKQLAVYKRREAWRQEHLSEFTALVPGTYSDVAEAVAACDAAAEIAGDIDTPGRRVLELASVIAANRERQSALKFAADAGAAYGAEQAAAKTAAQITSHFLPSPQVVVEGLGHGSVSPNKTVPARRTKASTVNIVELARVSTAKAKSKKKRSGDDATGNDGATRTRSKAKMDPFVDKPLIVLGKLMAVVTSKCRDGLGTRLGPVEVPRDFASGSQSLRDVITKQLEAKSTVKERADFLKKFDVYGGDSPEPPKTVAGMVGHILWILACAAAEGCVCGCSEDSFLKAPSSLHTVAL